MPDVPRSRAEREITLAAFGVSSETFDAWVLDRLGALLDEQLVRPGQLLWTRGQPVDLLYFMHDGRVQARRDDAPPWTFEGRWFLGGFEGHAGRLAERDLVSLDEFLLLTIRRRSWVELLEDSFELTRRTIVATSTAVARLEERLPPREESRSPRTPPSVDKGSLSMIERIAFLTGVAMASGTGLQALADLASSSEEIVLSAGDTVFGDASANDRLYVVVDGEVDATRRNPDVDRHYTRGDIVTGPAALSDHARQWSARARTWARLLAIPLEAWFDLMEEHFELVDYTLANLAIQRDRILTQLAADAGPEGLVLT
jgi:CRP-like cAMP-binding protein